jgi:hypothetical protein
VGIKEQLMLAGIELTTEFYGTEFCNALTEAGVILADTKVALNRKQPVNTEDKD